MILFYPACGGVFAFDLPANVQGETITAVSSNAEGLSSFRRVVLACIVEDVDPAYFVLKESTWKLQKSIKRLLKSTYVVDRESQYQPAASSLSK